MVDEIQPDPEHDAFARPCEDVAAKRLDKGLAGEQSDQQDDGAPDNGLPSRRVNEPLDDQRLHHGQP